MFVCLSGGQKLKILDKIAFGKYVPIKLLVTVHSLGVLYMDCCNHTALLDLANLYFK